MADTTAIEWCDTTLGLWIGCTQVSPACDNCYAMGWGKRFGVPWNAPPRRTADSAWAKIAAYQRGAKRFFEQHRRQRRVFINSLSDFFDNQAPQEWRDRACVEMEAAPDVIFILVTKRPQNVRKMVPLHWIRPNGGWPKNVWLVVTAENQQEFDRRLAHAFAIPNLPWTGLSIEPLLGKIHPGRAISLSAFERAQWASQIIKRPVDEKIVNRIGWSIIGGESGPKARPMPPLEQVKDVVRWMKCTGQPVFFKQLSQADYPGDAYKDYASFHRLLQQRDFPK